MACLEVGLRLYFLLSLLVTATHGDNGYFLGGTMSFYFTDTSNNDTYKAHVTVITGWVLGHGPCGPGCSVTDVGKSTHSSRASVIQSTGNPAIFGNWSKEQEITGIFPAIDEVSITDIVNQNIQGRVSSVSTRLKWEQEIAHMDVDIDTKYTYTDLVLNGDSWKAFDLNHDVSSGNNGGGVLPSRAFNLQTKIYPQIRNDTGKPNSSPHVLYKPIYRLQLNNVTRLNLTSLDKDGDYVKCRAGRNIEITGVGLMPNVTISEDCVITVSAMEQDGFRDDSWGVITVVLEDFNRQPIKRGNKNIRPYATSGLSSSILDFVVWVVANMTAPEFVSPTPVSQHVYTVYAGSKLSISLAARPSPQSPPTTQVVEFHLLSLPDHTLKARPLHPDPQQVSDRVVTSSVEWRTSDSDAGDFIIQVVAIDSDGFESLDRNYKIHVSDFQQDSGRRVNTKPYFPFFPAPGSITCPQGATCSLPIFASPGIASHAITSIGIVDARTAIPGIKTGTVERVTYRGVQTFRADVHLTSDMLGQQPVCFVAQDDHGLKTERCVDVSLYPPNPCDSLPCGNHATCIPDGINFTCICIPAYSGPLCDQWLDPCLHGPPDRCANGKCISKISYGAQFVCQCDPGFTGHFSCVDIDDCHADTCKNGGICEDKINGFVCHCINGYTGHDCSTALHGLFWSKDSLQDNAVLHVCSGDNATLQWLLRTGHADDEIVDIQWFYEGLSHEMMALLAHGQFVVLPAFSGRLRKLANAGLVLSHVTVSDSGNYSIEAVGGDLNSQEISRLHRTVVLEVSEPPLLANGGLRAKQYVEAVYNASRGQWAIKLLCGTFMSLGNPPVEMVWQTPSGRTIPSTGYNNGQFKLLLFHPMEGGTYTCAPRSKATPAGPLEHPCQLGSATVTVDETAARLTILEAENADLRRKLLECNQNR